MTDTTSSCSFATRNIGGRKKLYPKVILSMIDLSVAPPQTGCKWSIIEIFGTGSADWKGALRLFALRPAAKRMRHTSRLSAAGNSSQSLPVEPIHQDDHAAVTFFSPHRVSLSPGSTPAQPTSRAAISTTISSIEASLT